MFPVEGFFEGLVYASYYSVDTKHDFKSEDYVDEEEETFEFINVF